MKPPLFCVTLHAGWRPGMRYKSEIYEVVHRDALANFEVGAITESRMREFDEMCVAVASVMAEAEEPEIMEPVTA